MKHYYHPMSRGVTTDWMLAERFCRKNAEVVD
jgi:hypothetical protein